MHSIIVFVLKICSMLYYLFFVIIVVFVMRILFNVVCHLWFLSFFYQRTEGKALVVTHFTTGKAKNAEYQKYSVKAKYTSLDKAGSAYPMPAKRRKPRSFSRGLGGEYAEYKSLEPADGKGGATWHMVSAHTTRLPFLLGVNQKVPLISRVPHGPCTT